MFCVRVDGGPAERPALATACEYRNRFKYCERPMLGKGAYCIEVLCCGEQASTDRSGGLRET